MENKPLSLQLVAPWESTRLESITSLLVTCLRQIVLIDYDKPSVCCVFVCACMYRQTHSYVWYLTPVARSSGLTFHVEVILANEVTRLKPP